MTRSALNAAGVVLASVVLYAAHAVVMSAMNRGNEVMVYLLALAGAFAAIWAALSAAVDWAIARMERAIAAEKARERR